MPHRGPIVLAMLLALGGSAVPVGDRAAAATTTQLSQRYEITATLDGPAACSASFAGREIFGMFVIGSPSWINQNRCSIVAR